MNGEWFLADVKEGLVPTLSPGDIVLLDNSPPAGGIRRAPLGSHQSLKIKTAIAATGAKLRFLPRYSPDFNPPCATPLGHVLKKLLDFFDSDMLQLFDFERFLVDQVIPRDRETL